MSYFESVVRQHRSAKEGFGAGYEFDTKQWDILLLARTSLESTEKQVGKTERKIKKTKKEIEDLYAHLEELEDKLEGLVRKADDQHNYLEVASTVKESDV